MTIFGFSGYFMRSFFFDKSPCDSSFDWKLTKKSSLFDATHVSMNQKFFTFHECYFPEILLESFDRFWIFSSFQIDIRLRSRWFHMKRTAMVTDISYQKVICRMPIILQILHHAELNVWFRSKLNFTCQRTKTQKKYQPFIEWNRKRVEFIAINQTIDTVLSKKTIAPMGREVHEMNTHIDSIFQQISILIYH